MLLPPCPTCGTRLAVADNADLSKAQCPRCGTGLGPKPAHASGRRSALVLAALGACLALPLALFVPTLFSEPPAPDEPRVAKHEPAPTLPKPRPQSPSAPDDLLPVEPAPSPRPKDEPDDVLPHEPPPLISLIPPTDAKGNQYPSVIPPAEPPKPASVTVPVEPKSTSSSGGLGKPVEPVRPKGPKPAPPVVGPFPWANGKMQPPPDVPVQQITFMKAVGTGRRFCIIADCSGSMRGMRLAAVKAEVLRAIGSVRPDCEFYVIFFNSQAFPQPGLRWLRGGPNVAAVAPWIQAIPPQGGTQPEPAFAHALMLNPRPDVIFFLTDGEIPGSVPEVVARMNGNGPRVPVHTILFSDQGALSPQALQRAAAPMQVIAFQSGGTFSAVALPPSMPRPRKR